MKLAWLLTLSALCIPVVVAQTADEYVLSRRVELNDVQEQLEALTSSMAALRERPNIEIVGTMPIDGSFLVARKLTFTPNARVVFRVPDPSRTTLFVFADQIEIEDPEHHGTISIEYPENPPPPDPPRAASGRPGIRDAAPGEDGADGENGIDGAPGKDGPTLFVIVREPLPAGLRVELAGQDGANGGAGQPGGHGGAGAPGPSALQSAFQCKRRPGSGGDGGDGGDGGRGGDGGSGGAGGSQYFVTVPSSKFYIEPMAQVLGGKYGAEGRGGSGGLGGPAGESGRAKSPLCPPSGTFGDRGKNGSDGRAGIPGAFGKSGERYRLQISPEEFEEIFGPPTRPRWWWPFK